MKSTVNFYLRKPNGNSPTSILLVSRFNGQRLVFSTMQKIHPNFWDGDEQKVIQRSKNDEEHDYINDRIKEIGIFYKDTFRRLKMIGIKPTPDALKIELANRYHDQKIEVKIDLIRFVKQFIQDSTNIKREGTIKNYNTSLKHLEAFQKKHHLKMNFINIDIQFYNKYVRYLTNLNFTPNSVGNQIKNLILFIGEAKEYGIPVNEAYKSKRFKKPSNIADSIYLTEEELECIYNLDLNWSKGLDIVRDLFIVGCFTGLRFSDFSQIKKENIYKDENGTFIKLRTIKTDTIVEIPLRNEVKTILNKYQNNLPKAYTNATMNKKLKDIGVLAKINDNIQIVQNRGGKTTKEIIKKHKLIVSHTGRRSFATNAYLSGIDAISIMKITGHKTQSSFMRYIKISPKENAKKLSLHPFFNRDKYKLKAI